MAANERRLFCTEHGFVAPRNETVPVCPHAECGSRIARAHTPEVTPSTVPLPTTDAECGRADVG